MFELGSGCVFPLRDYPMAFQLRRTGVVTYITATDVQWNLLPTTLPPVVKEVISGLLQCDPRARMSLTHAIDALMTTVVV